MSFSLAYANIYHVLAALFGRFELELVGTVVEDVAFVRDQFVSKPRRGGGGVRLRVRGERGEDVCKEGERRGGKGGGMEGIGERGDGEGGS